jgi:transcriptional regulator with XRE-family HTH domain
VVKLRVKAWRTRRGWSLRTLGERSGVHFVTLARIEAGTMSPNLATLEKLARALDVTLRDLIAPEKRATTRSRRRRRR